MSDPLVLAIDIGTSSCRAIVFDARGRAAEGLRGQVQYAPHTDDAGAADFDANALVAHAAVAVDAALTAAGERAGAIAAVGVTTFWHSMVGVDADGAPVTPLYTWADTRAGAAAEQLRARLDPAEVHARTGCAIHPSYWPARLVWLSEAGPEMFRRVARWLSPGEYLFLRLFGAEQGERCSISMASATGLFDQNGCGWDGALLAALPIEEGQLTPLTDVDSPARSLRPEWAARWPALADVPWTPAIGDGAASNVGSGCVTDRRIAINLGTSGAIRVLWPADRVEIPPELWCYRLDRRRFVMGGAFSDGGEDYAWLRRTLQLPPDEEVERALAGRPAGSSGVTFLPFLAGERSVGWRPNATGTLHGLRLATDPLEIAHAVMEGIALRFALVAEALWRQFPDASDIRASGGALGASAVWSQMLCDALGRPLTVTDEHEATSRGAALMALRAAGLLADEADAPLPAGRTLAPDPANHARSRAALARQQQLYDKVTG